MKSLQYIVIFLCLCNYGMSGQEADLGADTTKYVEIIEAKKFVTELEGDDSYKYLYGDVLLQHDSVLFYSDTTLLINKIDISSHGNIIIRQGDSLNIFSDELEYAGAQKLAILKNEVVLENGNRKLFCDTMKYDAQEKIAYYETEALLVDEDAQLSSKRGELRVVEEMVYFYDSVTIVHPEFDLRTDSMKYDMKNNIAYFLKPTIINQNGAKIYTESGYYDIENEIAVFDKNPQYVEDDKILVSDKMRYIGAENKVYIEGNVLYLKEDKRLTADKLIYNDSTKIADAIGNVDYRSNDAQMTGDMVKYDTDSDQIITDGRTEIVDGTRIISSDKIDFSNKSGKGEAEQNVSIRDTTEGYELLAEKMKFDREIKSAESSGGRPLMILGKTGEDTLFLSADTIRTYEEVTVRDSTRQLYDTVRYMIADDSVMLYGKAFQGISDSLVFNGSDSSFTFYQAPILWTDTIQYKADTLRAIIKGNKIDYLLMSDDASIISTSDNLFYDQISGSRVEGMFKDGEISKVKINGNAETVVYLKDGKEYIGVDKASSAFLHVLFDKGELSGIKYYNDYAATVLPMIGTDHSSVRVKNFNWSIDKQPKSVDDLKYARGLHSLVQSRLGKKQDVKLLADTVQEVYAYDSENLVIKQISPHVFLHTSYLKTTEYGLVPCNGIIIASEESAVVIDTPTDSVASRELINYIYRSLDRQVRYVVPTHFHIDCLGGLAVFDHDGIPSLSLDKTQQLADSMGRVVPREIFEKETKVDLDSLEVILAFHGGGHTRDNIVVYIPKDKVLFGGCLIKSVGASKGNLEDAVISQWSETVQSVMSSYPDAQIIIPGHGKVGGRELLEYTEKLFMDK